MGRIGAILGGIICIMIFFWIASPTIAKGIHDWRTDPVTQVAIVATDPAVTTADIVLTDALFNNRTSEVESITSSITETPVVTTYVSETKTLTISALTDDTSRTLTIIYNSEVNDDIMTAIGPYLFVLISLFIIGMIVWGVVESKKGR